MDPGNVMDTWCVSLHLPAHPVRIVAHVRARTAWDAQARTLAQFPLLPPSCLWVNGEPLPSRGEPQVGPTPGQRLWRERRLRQRLAERHRQHWATKRERRQAPTHTPPPRPKP